MAVLDQLLTSVRKLDEISQRKISAIVGAAVADAAARPLHWVYDNNALQSYIADVKDTPEFFPESKSPFYTLPTGETSCYFDIAESVLNGVAAFSNSRYSYNTICNELVKSFGPGNPNYDLEARQVYMEQRRRGEIDGPIVGKWFHGALIKFLENYRDGIGSKPYGDPHIKETDGFCANLPLACKYVGSDTFDEMSLEIIQSMSTWPTAVSHGMVASKIIANIIRTGDAYNIMDIKQEIADSYPDVVKSLEAVESVIKQDLHHTRAVNYVFGSPCYNPGSFQGAIHAVQTSGSFKEAVRKTIRAGGCNCSRSFFIGAITGAKYGINGIPVDWMRKTNNIERIIKTALKTYP